MLRPLKILEDFGKKYPGCWKLMENFVVAKGKDGLPDYPEWCYVPVAGSYAVISGGGDGRVSDRGLRGNSPGLHPLSCPVSCYWKSLIVSGVYIPAATFQLLCLFFMGAVIHISCDFLTPMGIPLYPPFKKRVSLRLIRTGSIADFGFGFFPLGLFVLFFA